MCPGFWVHITLMGDFIKENPESIMQIMKNMANNMMKMQHQITQLSTELSDANDIASDMHKTLGYTLVGVKPYREELLVNPREYSVKANDELLVIAPVSSNVG